MRLPSLRHASLGVVVLSAAVSLSLVSPLLFGLFEGAVPLEHFRHRAIGETTLQGIDASGYSRNYVAMTALLGACFLGAFVVLACLERLLLRRIDAASIKKELRGIRRLSEVSIVLVLVRLIARDDFLVTLNLLVFGGILALFGLVVAKTVLHLRGRENGRVAVLLDDAPFVTALLFYPMPFLLAFQVAFEKPLGFADVSVVIGLPAYLGACLALFLVYYAFLRWRGVTDPATIRSWNTRLLWTAIPWILLPLSIPLANEWQYSFPDLAPRTLSLRVQAFLALLCVLFFILHRRGTFSPRPTRLLAGVYFPVFVATATVFKLHQHAATWRSLDYFHLGEFTLPTQQLFRFGSIPLIDLRPAHTLSDLFYQSIYTWFHGSQFHGMQGLDMMIWTKWMPAVVAMIVLYFCLARLASPVFAVLATSLTPVLNLVTSYYCYALIPALFLAGALRRPTTLRFCLVWASAVALTLWRFDFGVVGAVALALVLGVDLVRRPRRWKVMLRSLVIVAGSCFGGLVLLALASQRPVFETLFFLVKSYTFRLATRTRADIIADYSSAAVFQYYVLPAISLVFILYFAVRKLIRGRYIAPSQVLVVYLAIFSLVISLRSLERHSLIEAFNPYLSFFLLAVLPFFLAGPWTTRPTGRGAAFYGIVVVIAALALPPSSFLRSPLQHLFKPGPLFELHDWNVGERRIYYSDERHRDLVRFLDEHLQGNETFYDFTNSPLLYVFANKKFPTYVIPNIIQTSESVQSDVLEDLAALHDARLLPFVIFKQGNVYWDNVDHVPNEIRSYRIAEWIYERYRPFAVLDRYQVWIDQSHADPRSIWESLATTYPLGFTSDPQWNDMTDLGGDGQRSFRAGNRDPYVRGLFDLGHLPDLNNHPSWKLRVRYRSSSAGRMQVFYSLDGGKFGESASVSTDLTPTPDGSESEFFVPVPSGLMAQRLDDLRFDPPEGSEVTFLSAEAIACKTTRCRMRVDVVQRFPLAELPYVWAQYDPLQAVEATETLAVLLDQATPLEKDEEIVLQVDPRVDKSDGNYLHLRFEAASLVPEEGRVPRLVVEYGEGATSSFSLNLRRDSTTRTRTVLPWATDPALHDAERFFAGERLVFRPMGEDPYVHRVFDLDDVGPLVPGEAAYVVLGYRSLEAGPLQVFFGFNTYWFEPEDSLILDVKATAPDGQPARLVLPVPMGKVETGDGEVWLTDLRFDLPTGSLFEIVGAELIRQTSSPVDYLVRLSTQWAWTSQEVRELRLRSSAALTMERVVLRRGD